MKQITIIKLNTNTNTFRYETYNVQYKQKQRLQNLQKENNTPFRIRGALCQQVAFIHT